MKCLLLLLRFVGGARLTDRGLKRKSLFQFHIIGAKPKSKPETKPGKKSGKKFNNYSSVCDLFRLLKDDFKIRPAKERMSAGA